jgi:hypothetical protein
MFPAEAAGYLRFEFDVLGGIPLVDEGVFDEGLVEPEGEVAQGRHFIFGVGVVEADGAAVTGFRKGKAIRLRPGHRNGKNAGTFRHKEVRLKFLYKTTLIYKKR